MEITQSDNFNYKGSHVLADFTGIYGDEYKIGELVFDLMKRSIHRTTMKIMHSHLEILNVDTPPGYTSFLALDSSHISSHGYTDVGLLAFDCFTCGITNPMDIMEFIKEELSKEFPEMKCTYMKSHKRFQYPKN